MAGPGIGDIDEGRRIKHVKDVLPDTDLFRSHFKYYKNRKRPPDMKEVVDFSAPLASKDNNIVEVELCTPDKTAIAGLKPVSQWKAYTHRKCEGLLFIENPFLDGWEWYWVKRCLSDYPCKPNITNLDAHMDLTQVNNIWEQSVLQCKAGTSLEKTLLQKLRWVTLGYHHNWDTKKYTSDKHSEFPSDLDYLTKYIASALGYPEYVAEASIVNYYHLDSTLSGHTDHSEFYMEAPLFSFSFGQTAIFLLGGPTKQTEPMAMYIRSGDIVVMSGPARLAYHAIPKILPSLSTMYSCHSNIGTSEEGDNYDPYKPQKNAESKGASTELKNNESICSNDDHNCDEANEAFVNQTGKSAINYEDKTVQSINTCMEDTIKALNIEHYKEYLMRSRININVRQVLRPGEKFPSTTESPVKRDCEVDVSPENKCVEDSFVKDKKPKLEENL